MSNQNIQVNKFFHRGQWRIGLYFSYNTEVINRLKSIGAKWSKTHTCWYVNYNVDTYQKLKSLTLKLVLPPQLKVGNPTAGEELRVNPSIPVKGASPLAPVKGDYNSEYRGVNHSAFFSDFKLLESCTAFRYFQYLLGEFSIKIRVIFTQHTQKKIGGTFRARDHTNMFKKPVKIRTNVRVYTS